MQHKQVREIINNYLIFREDAKRELNRQIKLIEVEEKQCVHCLVNGEKTDREHFIMEVINELFLLDEFCSKFELENKKGEKMEFFNKNECYLCSVEKFINEYC